MYYLNVLHALMVQSTHLTIYCCFYRRVFYAFDFEMSVNGGDEAGGVPAVELYLPVVDT